MAKKKIDPNANQQMDSQMNQQMNQPINQNQPIRQPMEQPMAQNRLGDDLEARKQTEINMLNQTLVNEQNRVNAAPKIGSAEVLKATDILRKYKEGKQQLEKRLIAHEEFWKLRQWRMLKNDDKDFNPSTAWLWSCIQSRYSDAMDSYPTCNFQPRQRDDVAEAMMLSNIVPVIMEQNRYEEVYSDVCWYTLKHGGSVQGIFWNGSKHNGLGDIEVKQVDFINLFWQPGIKNIQDSRNVFLAELVDNDIINQRYPETVGKLNANAVELAKYIYDDTIDTSEKSVVIDWYYHTEYNGKKVLHYCKYVNDIVLYATENDTEVPMIQSVDPETGVPLLVPNGESVAQRGLYDHAQYPFVVMSLYPIEGSLCGYGLTDIGRDTQLSIDRLNKAILDNAVVSSTPRDFVSNTSAINEEEYTDLTKKLIHVDGPIDDNHVKSQQHPVLSSIYVQFLQTQIDDIKYFTSNQDVANGAAPSGITAASAVAALQETAGKNSRSSNKAFHRAYREVCYQVLELIRQFYDVPRTFRVIPDAMSGEQFATYSNANLVPQMQTGIYGENLGYRLPEFDIDVTSEKANPYKKMEINELALSFYNAGFYNPQMADQALACLDMMDFQKKEDVIAKIRENGTIYETMLQYQQMALQLAQQVDPALADQLAQTILANGQGASPSVMGMAAETNLDGGNEHPFVERARENARQSTQAE